jgi:hypothetical protein
MTEIVNHNDSRATSSDFPSRRLIALCGAIVVVMLGVAWAVLSNVSGERLVAASVALIGTALTASVTVIGFGFTHLTSERNRQLQRESEERLRLEAERTHRLQQESEKRLFLEGKRTHQIQEAAEDRLRLEASMRAVSLIAQANDTRASRLAIAGALLALTDLRSTAFAVASLREVMREDEKAISPSAAILLIEKGLSDPSSSVKSSAATILEDHAEYFGKHGVTNLPGDLHENWDPGLPKFIKIRLLVYLIDANMARSSIRSTGDLESLTIPLHNMLEDSDLNGMAARYMQPICEKLCKMWPRKVHRLGLRVVRFDNELNSKVNYLAQRERSPAVKLKARLEPFQQWIDGAEKLWLQNSQANRADEEDV